MLGRNGNTGSDNVEDISHGGELRPRSRWDHIGIVGHMRFKCLQNGRAQILDELKKGWVVSA